MNSSHMARSLVHLLALAALALVALVFAPSSDAAFAGKNGDIAYARPAGKGFHIFSYNTRTGKSKQLTTDKLRGDRAKTVAYEPSYGPTGKRIVFLNLVDTKSSGGRRADVYVMHADGSHVKRLTKTPAGESAPTFSADGKMIAYSLRGKTYVMRSNGRGKRVELTAELPKGGVGATFSPDGTKVAVASTDGGDSDIFVMNVDGSDPVNVTAGSTGGDYSPDFAPDGSRIAFISGRDDYHGDLFTMAAGGSDVVKVAGGDGLEADSPAYSPDGEQIAYETRLEKSGAILVATVPANGGSEPKALRNAGSYSEEPSWGVKPS